MEFTEAESNMNDGGGVRVSAFTPKKHYNQLLHTFLARSSTFGARGLGPPSRTRPPRVDPRVASRRPSPRLAGLLHSRVRLLPRELGLPRHHAYPLPQKMSHPACMHCLGFMPSTEDEIHVDGCASKLKFYRSRLASGLADTHRQ